MTIWKTDFEKCVGKGENEGNKGFFPFSNLVFYYLQDKSYYFSHTLFVVFNSLPNKHFLDWSKLKAFENSIWRQQNNYN